MYAGLNFGAPAYGIATLANNKWENFQIAGSGTKPPTHRDVTIEVQVKGSEVKLLIDTVLVAQGTYQVRSSQLGFLIGGSHPLEIELLSVSKADSIAFVVMQFTEEFNSLYTEVIAPTCERFGFTVVRGDDIYNNGLIIEDISRSIRESAVIIADITPDNPNVFYEVGFAHGIGKPTVLLAERRRLPLPFDVHGFRTVFYDNSIGGKSAVEKALTKHLEDLAAR